MINYICAIRFSLSSLFFLLLLSSQCSFLCTSVLISPLCPFPLRVRQIPCPCPAFSFPVSSSRRQTGYMNPHGNRTPRRWEQDSQALGTGFPGVGNRIPGCWEQPSRYSGAFVQCSLLFLVRVLSVLLSNLVDLDMFCIKSRLCKEQYVCLFKPRWSSVTSPLCPLSLRVRRPP